MTRATKTFTVTVQAASQYPGVPTYVVNATAGQWSKINVNTALSVKFPGWGSGGYPAQGDDLYLQLYDVWTGAGYDAPRKRMYFHGGAHGSYSGNEFYYFDIATGMFGRVNDPGPYVLPSSGDPPSGLMPDGLPMVIHTYVTLECDASGVIYRLGSGASAVANIWKFNTQYASNPMPYSSAGTLGAWTNTGVTLGEGFSGGFVWDSVSGAFYGGMNKSGWFMPFKYTPGTNTGGALAYNGFPNGFATDLDPSVGIDTSRRLMYVVGGQYDYRGMISGVSRGTIIYNIAANTWTELTPTTTGNKTPESSSAAGLTYDSRRDKMVYYLGKPTTAPFYTFDYTTKVWTLVTPSGPNPPAVTQDGTYNKFRYIPEYDVFILCDASSTNGTVEMWMYKPTNWMG